MKHAVGAVMPFAVGAAVSPIPLVAAIVVLFTRRARTNGAVYLLGWAGGSAIVVTAAYVASRALGLGTADGADATTGVHTGLGVVLLVLAARKWRTRPSPEDATTPGWMEKIDGFGSGRILGLGGLLSVNPKNVVLAIGAATALSQTDASTAAAAVGLVVFVVLGSAGVIAAVGYAVVGGDRSTATLERTRDWMIANNAGVMAALLLVFGALLVSQGLMTS